MRVREHLNCIREGSIRYIVVWDLSLRWRMAARIVISRRDAKKLVPEGVEGRVAYKGHVEDTVFQLMGGLRSGMGYCGAENIEILKTTGKFVKISSASLKRVTSSRYSYHKGSSELQH